MELLVEVNLVKKMNFMLKIIQIPPTPFFKGGGSKISSHQYHPPFEKGGWGDFLTVTLIALCYLMISSVASANQLTTVDKALKKVYKQATDFKKDTIELSLKQKTNIEETVGISFNESHSSTITVHIAIKEENIIGYAFEDNVVGKMGADSLLSSGECSRGDCGGYNFRLF